MFVKVTSGAVMGVDGHLVDVEVDLTNGLPGFDVVGLPDSAVKESRERVRAAVRNSGYTFPVKRITVNLAPADMRKSGPAFDLPVAVGILMCTGVVKPTAADGAFFAGELSLDGALRPVNGILPMAIKAKARGVRAFFVAAENANEAALVGDVDVFPIRNIIELVEHFDNKPVTRLEVNTAEYFSQKKDSTYDVDFADVAGQAHVKRALEIAAAGYHNALMIGPPGAGKTMLARRMPTILPDLSIDESMEITKIYSIAGLIDQKNLLMNTRPFRTPHHTSSYISLTGGGRTPMPGEISLAHNGVLFLDELPEFQKKALETLRQPLEDGQITISRVGGVCTYPSVFLLMAAMNPCPCGYMGTPRCTCSDSEVARYLDKISGPLLDRIDIQIEASPVDFNELTTTKKAAESSADIKSRVESARERQQFRFAKDPIYFNSKMTAALVKRHCKVGHEARQLLQQVFETLNLSARAYHKVLKIARTIADLQDSAEISTEHVAEAVAYRGLDRKYW